MLESQRHDFKGDGDYCQQCPQRREHWIHQSGDANSPDYEGVAVNKITFSMGIYAAAVAGVAVALHSGSSIAGLRTFSLWLTGTLLWMAVAFVVSRISIRK